LIEVSEAIKSKEDQPQITRKDEEANCEFLLDTGVRPWTEVPLWIPEEDAHNRFFLAVNCEKARAAGLRFRPLAETIRDTLEWDHSRPASMPRRAGLSREREMEVLKGWRSNTEPVNN